MKTVSLVRNRLSRCEYGMPTLYILLTVLIMAWITYLDIRNPVIGQRVIPPHKKSQVTDVNYTHIITTTDAKFFPGVATLIHSLQQSSEEPTTVKVHVLVCGEEGDVIALREYLECHGINGSHLIQLVRFDTSFLEEDVKKAWQGMFLGERLKSDCNYARTYLYRLFPDLSRAIILDADVVVIQPIETLWRASLEHQAPLSAVVNKKTYNSNDFLISRVSHLYAQRYGKPLLVTDPLFNGGVMVIDLEFYRKYNLIDEMEFWLKQNSCIKRPCQPQYMLCDLSSSTCLQRYFGNMTTRHYFN